MNLTNLRKCFIQSISAYRADGEARSPSRRGRNLGSCLNVGHISGPHIFICVGNVYNLKHAFVYNTYGPLINQRIRGKEYGPIGTAHYYNRRSYQFRRSCRLTVSYAFLVSVRLGSSSARYCSTAWSILNTGNSPRDASDCGRRISSIQSISKTAMSDDTACTFA